MSRLLFIYSKKVVPNCRNVCSILLYSLFVFTILTLASCTTNPDLTGTTSGTEAKVAQGCIVKEDGTAAALARVIIIPSNYNPLSDTIADSALSITNDKGEFELFVPDTGLYNIQARLRDGSCLLIGAVHIVDKITNVPVSTLHKPGTINVKLPDDIDTVNGYLYLPGTDLFIRLYGKSDTVTINAVPESDLLSINYSRVNSEVPQTLQNDIVVHAGNTTFVALYNWEYSADLYFTTTAAGAGIATDVTNFPVLVRLNTEIFNFSQAQSAGEDIRFTKANGSSLPYEIEVWDGSTGKAVIWVNVDTVYGNDSSQFITMHWGNSTSGSESDSKSVFDTSEGFRGVWHFDNVGKQLPDATANSFTGSISDTLTRYHGAIGYGQLFDSTGGFADVGNVCNPGTTDLTFSAWIKKSVLGKRQTIISKSKGGSASSTYGWLLELDPDGAPIQFMASTSGAWGNPGTFVMASDTWISDTAWHHIAVVIDRQKENNSHIYVDGSEAGSALVTGTTTAGDITNTVPLRFGADGNGNNNWNGALDEITLSNVTRSKAYIQLMFENQKSDSKLIRIANIHK